MVAAAPATDARPDKGADMTGDERTDNGHHAVPEDPQPEPEQAVDAMEERVLGDSADSPSQNEQEDEQEDVTPAFEQDLDPQDQGSAEAAAEQSG